MNIAKRICGLFVDKIQASDNQYIGFDKSLDVGEIMSLPFSKTVAKKTFFQAFQSFKDSLGNLKLMVLL